MPPHPAASDIWSGLTLSHRREITDHLRAALSIFANAPTLTDTEIEDVARWTVEGLSRTSLRDDAFDEGYEAGLAAGMERAS